MKYVVGVADMKISASSGDVIVTHALGSCLGIAIYDPKAKVGGMLHVMLPQSKIDPQKAAENPYMFIDTGIPKLFTDCYAKGADRKRLIIKVAGGASFRDVDTDIFAIGKRNYIMLRKLLWKNGFMISSEDIGGTISRTMFLDISTGRTWLRSSAARSGIYDK